jgi:peptide/nickel transport system substrate-binding protein
VIQYLMDNAVQVGLYTRGWVGVFAVRPAVEGFKIGAFLHPMFNDVTVH